MRIDFMTLFPNMIQSAFSESIVARGAEAGFIELHYHQIRDYTENKQKKVDDYPYGGGPGLIMSYQPIADTYKAVLAQLPEGAKPHCIYMSPQGKVLNENIALRLSKEENLIILCGHYEGIDERVIEDIVDEEISIGDYVLTGGELPACVLCDSVARLVPGVLASSEAYSNESHSDKLLEYPQYTRPAEINGKKVPEVLLSGNHGDIEKWRLERSRERTRYKRPDIVTDIYFDNAATTRPSAAAMDTVLKTASYYYGNPSALHGLGFSAEKELKKARAVLADIIGAEEKEIFFTSGGTESNNWAIRGALDGNPRKKGNIIISAGEHPSVSETAKQLAASGRKVDILPLTEKGVPDIEALKGIINEDTALISVLHVNSETGAVTDIEALCKAARAVSPDVIIHCDCVQSFCKLDVLPKKWGADMISVSGHKVRGPRGTGFLYVRKGLNIKPLLYGGGQETGLRSGTENLPAIAGFACAAAEFYKDKDENYSRITELNDMIRQYISDNTGKALFISDKNYCSPYILSVSFPGIGAEVLQHSLEAYEVFVSVGSACSSHKKERSRTLTAMGLDLKTIDGAVRLSFSPDNTKGDGTFGSKAIVECIKTLYKRKRH